MFVKPQAYEQEHYVHSAIYGEVSGEKSAAGQAVRQANGIKSGEFDRNAELLAKAIEPLVAKGVNTMILGCTELPLVRKQLEQAFPNLNYIDPMEAVAERAVEIYQQAEQALKQGALAEVIPAISDIHNNQDIVNYVLSRARV